MRKLIMKKTILTLSVSFLMLGCGGSNSSSSSSSSSTAGQGGSMARFAMSGDYLYTINQQEMNVLNLSNPIKPKQLNKIRVPFDVETLFAYKNSLYVGSNSGMYIYDISNPIQPIKISNFTHAQSCDPVVVADDIAYVTLNSSASCWQKTGINRLEMIDVSNPSNPRFIKAVDMWEPKGLGVDGNNLFICDGSNGLKVYDINKTKSESNNLLNVTISLKDTQSDIDCYDLIAKNKNLVISNHQDIRQFDYTTFPMQERGEVK